MQSPRDWIDLKLPLRDDFRHSDNRLPWRFRLLQIVGFGALLAFPVATFGIREPYALFLGCAVVFLGFIGLGAGSRPAGSLLRGSLMGATLYLLLGAALGAVWVLRVGPPPDLVGFLFLVLGWPLVGLYLLGFLG